MKRMDINLPHEGVALFERLLKQTPGTLRDYEIKDVSKYTQGGRIIIGYRQYSFRYENKEDKENLLKVFHRVAETINEDIPCEEYNINSYSVKVKGES